MKNANALSLVDLFGSLEAFIEVLADESWERERGIEEEEENGGAESVNWLFVYF